MALRQVAPQKPPRPAEHTLPVAYIEKLFSQLGVTRESLHGIPGFPKPKRKIRAGLALEQRLAWIKAVWAICYVSEKLNPELRRAPLAIDAKDLQWFEAELRTLPPLHYAVSDTGTGKAKIHYLPRVSKEAERTLAEIEDYLGFKPLSLSVTMLQIATRWAQEAPIDSSQKSTSILPPAGGKMVEQDTKALIVDGITYFPLSTAAPRAQTHRTTLLNWVKNKTEFAGRPLQSYHFAPLDSYFVSEESIERAAHRFVKWPSQEPAGPVIIGKMEDQSGFLAMPDAARIIRVSPRTMWLWASQGKAPTEKPLDVIKCTASDYFYIRERDAHRLKTLIPRSGLHRGRRPQTSPHPS
jgi:hypothetical protein